MPVTNLMPSATMQFDAALHDCLIELHVGDAIHEQAADSVSTLEHGDVVAGLIELVRRTRARPGPEPTTATRRPVRIGGGLGRSNLLKPAVNDGVFDAS